MTQIWPSEERRSLEKMRSAINKPVRTSRVPAEAAGQGLLFPYIPLSERVPVLLMVLDRRRRIVVHANSRAKIVLGYSTGELVAAGTTVDSLLGEAGTPHRTLFAVQANSEGQEVLEGEIELRVHGGQWRWFEYRERVLTRDSDGSAIESALVLVDITERKRASDALERIIRSTSRASGKPFFESLVRELADAYGCRYACVSTIASDNSSQLRTIAMVRDGELVQIPDFDISGTPSGDVLQGSGHYFEDGLQELYPDDSLLKQFGVRSFIGAPLVSDSGVPIGVVAVLHDAPLKLDETLRPLINLFAARAGAEIERLSTNEQLRISERRNETILDAIEEGFLLIDPTGTIVQANRRASALLGFEPDKLTGMSRNDLNWAPVDENGLPISGIPPWKRSLRNGQVVRGFIVKYRKPDGAETWLSANTQPYEFGPSGKPTLVLATFTDVTAVRETESLRKQLNEALEQKVRERTTQLEIAMRELESFSYTVSHDLRTPLRSINAMSTLLKEDHGELLTEEADELLLNIKRASQQMNALIEGLLDLSRIVRSDVRMDTVDLSKLAQRAIDQLRRTDQNRAVQTRIQEGVHARGDARLLADALANLLDNAWKYTRYVQAPVIEFGALAQTGNSVYFVRDNGAGFDPAYSSKLFAPFERLHSSREFEGSGIGLSTFARIIDRHQGRCWAESQPGQGATFYFTLPATT